MFLSPHLFREVWILIPSLVAEHSKCDWDSDTSLSGATVLHGRTLGESDFWCNHDERFRIMRKKLHNKGHAWNSATDLVDQLMIYSDFTGLYGTKERERNRHRVHQTTSCWGSARIEMQLICWTHDDLCRKPIVLKLNMKPLFFRNSFSNWKPSANFPC